MHGGCEIGLGIPQQSICDTPSFQIRNPTPPTPIGARAATVECPKVPGCDTFGRKGEEGDLLAVHPTVKPMAMVLVIDSLQSGKRAW
jgi:hypothetical protein